MKRSKWFIGGMALLAWTATTACGTDSSSSGDVCSGILCSSHGTCYDNGGSAACDCDADYHAAGVTCVLDNTGTNVCDGVTCSSHGTCYDNSGAAACSCDTDYHAEGLNCVADTTNVCDGVTCSSHGTCYDNSGAAACSCDTDYHAEGLNCVADAAGFAGSCYVSSTYDFCVGYTGSLYTANDVQTACSAFSGTYSTDYCTATGTAGYCTIKGGTTEETINRYYEMDAAAAESSCGYSGGVWTAN